MDDNRLVPPNETAITLVGSKEHVGLSTWDLGDLDSAAVWQDPYSGNLRLDANCSLLAEDLSK